MFLPKSKAMVNLEVLQSDSPTTQQSAFKAPQKRRPPVLYHEALTLEELLYDTKLKLEEFSTNTTTMDPNGGHHGGNRSGHAGHYGYDPKGHGGDPGVFDGLLPRIETRGQSRGGRSKYDDKSKRGSKR